MFPRSVLENENVHIFLHFPFLRNGVRKQQRTGEKITAYERQRGSGSGGSPRGRRGSSARCEIRRGARRPGAWVGRGVSAVVSAFARRIFSGSDDALDARVDGARARGSLGVCSTQTHSKSQIAHTACATHVSTTPYTRTEPEAEHTHNSQTPYSLNTVYVICIELRRHWLIIYGTCPGGLRATTP